MDTRRMTLRNGKEAGTEEDREEGRVEDAGIQAQEEVRYGSGDFHVEYLEQGGRNTEHEERDEDGIEKEQDRTVVNVEDGEDNEEQKRREEYERVHTRQEAPGMEGCSMEDLMMFLYNMKQELKQGFNKKFEESQNKLEEIKEELKMEMNRNLEWQAQGIGELREETIKIRKDMEEQDKQLRKEIIDQGIKVRSDMEKDVQGKVKDFSKQVEANMAGEVRREVGIQYQELRREIGQVEIQAEKCWETVETLKINVEQKLEKVNGEVKKQYGDHRRHTEVMGTKFNREMEEMNRKLRETMEEMEDNIRRADRGNVYMGNVGNNIDLGVKFDGNLNIIHPKVFIKIVKSKIRGIRDIMEQKLIIRGMLTGHALLWFCNKEETIGNMEEFEKQFLMYFWGEIHQATFRERLYFGKFDFDKSKNLNAYAMQLYNVAQYLEPPMKEEELVLYVGRHFNAEVSETIALHNIKKMDGLSNYLQRVERSTQMGNGGSRYQRENRESERREEHRENGNENYRRDNFNRFGNRNFGNGYHGSRGNFGNGYRNNGNGNYGNQGNYDRRNYNGNRNGQWQQNRGDMRNNFDGRNDQDRRNYGRDNQERNYDRGNYPEDNRRQVNNVVQAQVGEGDVQGQGNMVNFA